MGEPADDGSLLEELRDALAQVPQPPAHVVSAARAAFAYRDPDADLAVLTWDSEVDAGFAVSSCGSGLLRPRSMTFEREGLLVELELEIEVGVPVRCYRLTGQLAPPQSATVQLLVERHDPVSLRADGQSRFTAVAVPAGLFRLRVLREGERSVLTSWMRV
ncbi:MAG TPA: hypothetical protein VHN80_11785 [Kineosporiaceae bacterium]|nr:hypothetical protein [Kineosporiaceae bacterium]